MRKIKSRGKNWIGMLMFSLIFFIPCPSTAQKINYGIKGGVSISKVSMLEFETHSKTGFSIYAFGEYNLSKNFAVSTQIGYTQKGFRTKTFDYYSDPDNTHYYGAINANLDYVDISVSGKLIFNLGHVSPYLSLGPSLGIKVGAGTSGTGNLNHYERGDLQSLLDAVYTNSFGVRTGAGVELHLIKNMSILLETNFSYDLISTYDEPNIHVGVESWYFSDNVKTSVLEFLVGVKF